jgi:hypothetical protein
MHVELEGVFYMSPMRSACRRVAGVAVLAAWVVVATIRVEALADDFTKPIRVSADGHYLVQPDGEPFFWLGDTGWLLFARLNREEADHYLKDRAEKGFTVIQAVILGLVDPVATPNRYGALPLIDQDPSRPNPAYFENVDWVVDRASRYGLRIAMLPAWGAAVIGGYLGDHKQRIFTTKNAQEYGRWLGARYQNRGIIWILGGDTNPIGVDATWQADKVIPSVDMKIVDYRPLYDAMARGIFAGEGGTPFISYHITCCSWPGTAQPRTSLYLADRRWLTMNMLQSSHFRHPKSQTLFPGVAFAWDGTRNYEPIKDEYDSVPTRPVVDGEPRYEDLTVDVEWQDAERIKEYGYWTAYDARNAAYHAVFAGAAGHTYGNAMVWQFYNPSNFPPVPPVIADLTWQNALQRPGAGQVQYLKALMLSRPYFARIPDQSLIIGDSEQGERHISGTRDRGGSYAMVFVPKRQSVTVDLNKIAGTQANAWWFDPRTGTATQVNQTFPTSGPTTFTPPYSSTGEDWVLVVDDVSKGYGVPGRQAVVGAN